MVGPQSEFVRQTTHVCDAVLQRRAEPEQSVDVVHPSASPRRPESLVGRASPDAPPSAASSLEGAASVDPAFGSNRSKSRPHASMGKATSARSGTYRMSYLAYF